MALLRWVALDVRDEEAYARYREAMVPILTEKGGRFTLDCRVSSVMTSPTDHPINWVIALEFPDTDAMEAFYADPRYQAARRDHFDLAVAGTTMLGIMPGDGLG